VFVDLLKENSIIIRESEPTAIKMLGWFSASSVDLHQQKHTATEQYQTRTKISDNRNTSSIALPTVPLIAVFDLVP